MGVASENSGQASRGETRTARPSAWEDEDAEQAYKTVSRQEAVELRKSLPILSPWLVVAMQSLAACLCGLVVWLVTGSVGSMWSAIYGAAAVVLPNMLLARGMTKRAESPTALAVGFLFWEMLKIGVAIAMLVIATKVLPNLSWPALLIGLVVCIKVNWLALLWRGR